jgi:hypothetical protein
VEDSAGVGVLDSEYTYDVGVYIAPGAVDLIISMRITSMRFHCT